MEEIYLITGAAGFLGHEVAKQLAARPSVMAGQTKVVGLRLPGDKAKLIPSVEYQNVCRRTGFKQPAGRKVTCSS